MHSNNLKRRRRKKHLLSRRSQAERYEKSVRTIVRWGKDPKMNMPPEYDLNGHWHRDEEELEDWERSRVVVSAEAGEPRRWGGSEQPTANQHSKD